MPEKLSLPSTFPHSDYTPFGYLDNPYHSGVLNRSGVIRTVPPLGMGWWARAMPWPYGIDVEGRPGYLSFLQLSVNVSFPRPPAPSPTRGEGESRSAGAFPVEERYTGMRDTFHTAADFAAHNVELVSRYHTRTLMSYDFTVNDLTFSVKYLLASEHALACFVEIDNNSEFERAVTLHAAHIYGYPGPMYWGRDGVTSRQAGGLAISKVWAYGDVFALGADRPAAAYKATADDAEWGRWVAANDLATNNGAVTDFHKGGDHLVSVMSYRLTIPVKGSDTLTLALARGVNEVYTTREFHRVIGSAHAIAREKLAHDESFYAGAPLLDGDWPAHWKHGWVYDLETIRMTIRPPLGIYKHPWDGMQIHTPRAVLGETCLDALCLSYADVELAQEVIYGTFADAPMPNVPCSREDGSMNMIGESGAECGTAPTWGFPFLVIDSIYRRTGDDDWIRRLYPYLKAFIEWWIDNRTDAEGWFHADNSWESGQDGSKRFTHGEGGEGAAAHFVRTVDIEAALAHAMLRMVDWAEIAGSKTDGETWARLAEDRIQRTRSMYVDGWFRDFDARTDPATPFLLADYYDAMMLTPLAVGIATPEQVEGVKPKFEIFRQNPRHWLEWPSFWLPISEAAWNSGLRAWTADELYKVGERIYQRTDAREISPVSERYPDRLPAPYSYRIPGVASEFWPVDLHAHPILNGCENYGWGATFPSLVIRNIVGFREHPSPRTPLPRREGLSASLQAGETDSIPLGDASLGSPLPMRERGQGGEGFILAPTIPAALAGKRLGITNLRWRDTRFDVYAERRENQLTVRLALRPRESQTVTVRDAAGQVVTQTSVPTRAADLEFVGENGAVYTVEIA